MTLHHLKVSSTAKQFIIVFGDQKCANTFFHLDLDVPQLRPVLQVIGGYLDLLFLHDPLLVKI